MNAAPIVMIDSQNRRFVSDFRRAVMDVLQDDGQLVIVPDPITVPSYLREAGLA